MRGILEHLHTSGSLLTVTDMQAGLEHLKRGTLEHADALMIIVEPYFKSLEAAGQIAELARGLGVPSLYAVANKVHTDQDKAAFRDYWAAHALPVLVVVTYDPDVAEAERQGRAVIDQASGALAVGAIHELACLLTTVEPPARAI